MMLASGVWATADTAITTRIPIPHAAWRQAPAPAPRPNTTVGVVTELRIGISSRRSVGIGLWAEARGEDAGRAFAVGPRSEWEDVAGRTNCRPCILRQRVI